jgi:hypothetical protein
MRSLHRNKLNFMEWLKTYTKKHFIDLAQFLKSTKATTKAELTKALIEHFEIDNKKFNKAKFLKAVGCA